MEANVNKVEICGFLGRDAQVKPFGNGRSLTSISLATTERYKNQKGEWVSNTTWHNVTYWKEPAPALKEQLKKGACLSVEGKLSSRKYTDKEGQIRTITEIIASKLELVQENNILGKDVAKAG